MKKRLFSALICLCMLLSAVTLLPQGTLTQLFSFGAGAEVSSGKCGENVTWTLDENGKLTISGTGEVYRFTFGDSPFRKDLSIRSLVIEEGVTSIGDFMFDGCENLESVSVASSVTDYYYDAFQDTKWLIEQQKINPCVVLNGILIDAHTCTDEVTIPNTVKMIGKGAFSNTKVWKVNIPEGVEKIDWSAFGGCSYLTSVNIPDSLHTIDHSAFSGCDLWSIEFGKGVKTIGSEAFACNEKLSSIIIPDNVESIDTKAFTGCTGIKSVSIGSGLKELAPTCFLGCEKLTEITVSEDNPYFTCIDNVVYNKQLTELALCPNTKSVNITEGITRIPDSFFYHNDYVENVYLPDTLEEIGDDAFVKCNNLKEIHFSGGLKRIIEDAFSSCSSLESVVIPDSVTNIGQYAFGYAENLKSIDLSNNPLYTMITQQAFQQCSSLKEIDIPQNIETIDDYSFSDCDSLENVKLHEGLKKINFMAFYSCGNLKSITIPKSVEKIWFDALGYGNVLIEDEWVKTKYPGFTIYCYAGTEGERYAKRNGFNYVILDECEHDCTVQTVPATCLKFGYDLHTCKKCGETFKDNFTDLLGHGWSDWEQTDKPSCIKTGSETKVCSRCGLSVTRSTAKTQHSWGEWTVIEKPSAARLGLKERSCKVCRKIESEVMPKDESVIDIWRLYGKDRFETALTISRSSFLLSESVVIANGMQFADALAGVPLAKKLGAPILLTKQDSLPEGTIDEIKRLGASNAYILGGPGAVSEKIEIELDDNGINVERLFGKNRFETAVSVAQKISDEPSVIFFAYYNDFADALSVSTPAAVIGAPIVYLPTDGEIDRATMSYLESIKRGVKKAYVIGGSGVISDRMMRTAERALDMDIDEIVRLSGKDRYETCTQVNKEFSHILTGDSVCTATGTRFPDVLAGGVFAADKGAPLVLVNGDAKKPMLPECLKEYLSIRKASSVYVFGGTGAVSDELAQLVADGSKKNT